jgi:hypothetical protein
VIPGHYEYVADPAGNGIVFRGHLTENLKIDDPESVHLHPDIYFDTFHPGSYSVHFDVWVDDLKPDALGPYREKPWLNLLTVFDRTTWTGDQRFEPSVMTNLVGSPGAYFLQTYSMSPEAGGTFFDTESDAPSFPTKQWVHVKVSVDVQTSIVQSYQNGVLVSKGPYRSRPGIAGAHMGLYSNRLVKSATVYNRACEITVGPAHGSSTTIDGTRELLMNGNFAHGGSDWQVNHVGNATSQVEVVPEGPRGEAALRMQVLTLSELPWHLQMFQPGLSIKKNEAYVLTFWAKSNRDGNIKVNCMQNHEPWEHSTEKEVSLSSDWRQVEFTFHGPWDDNDARITFTDLGTDTGRIYWFASCSLKLQNAAN